MLSFCEKIRKNACRLIIILYLCSANTKYEIKMSNLIKPEGYKALLDMRDKESKRVASIGNHIFYRH